MKLQYHKSTVNRIFTSMCVLIVLLLSACDINTKNEENFSVQEPSLPLEAYNGEFLYGDIPTPKDADVFVFASSTDNNFDHYSFTFENFSLEDAKEYVALLEKSVVKKREAYDVYAENDYPILNYFGWLKDGSAISLSQSDSSGGIMINIKKGE